MEENLRIRKLFSDLFDGDPWIDVSLMGTLGSISADKASRKILSLPNSIWEILNHLIRWRETVLQRIQGKMLTTPAHNFFEPVTDTSEAAWKDTLEHLKISQDQWLEFLNRFDANHFSDKNDSNNKTDYEHIQGIIQHDAYHLGQITLLAKHF